MAETCTLGQTEITGALSEPSEEKTKWGRASVVIRESESGVLLRIDGEGDVADTLELLPEGAAISAKCDIVAISGSRRDGTGYRFIALQAAQATLDGPMPLTPPAVSDDADDDDMPF